MKKDKPRKQKAGHASLDGRRQRRKRPVPRWLVGQKDLDEMARRRCLMVLSVLSGEKAVSDAIEEAGISRPLYYDLETRALRGMLAALTPQAAGQSEPDAVTPWQKIAQLEAKVARLECDKRRAERLLLLTRRVVKPGPLSTGRGRPPKHASRKLSRGGPKRSERSTSPISERGQPPASSGGGGGP